MAMLSLVFLPASLLSFRFSNLQVCWFYRVTAFWMGLANFLFVAAWLAWLVDLVLRFAVPASSRISDRPYVAGVLLALSVATSLFGLINARALRVRHLTVTLPRLPRTWQGRSALLISDMHLGHVNVSQFAKRIAATARELNPEIIFIAGDLFDGTKVNAQEMIAPLKEMKAHLGVFFVSGNHEEYGGLAKFEEAVRSVGIRVLQNECVTVDGMRIVGVPYGPTRLVPCTCGPFWRNLA